MNGTISVSSEASLTITVIMINLIIGVTCCATAYFILSNMKVKVKEMNDEVLDDLGVEGYRS